MADRSHIEWTDATWSPVTGCDPISPGCKHCYAKREVETRWSKNPKSVFFGRAFNDVQCHPSALEQPLRWKKPKRIFVCPRADLFHEEVPFEFIAAVFGVMGLARWHTFQVLTKRPARMREFFAWLGQQTWHKEAHVARVNHAEFICDEPKGKRGAEQAAVEALACAAYSDRERIRTHGHPHGSYCPKWPIPNVQLGVSVEDQAAADERIPLLLATPAVVRWVSAEPLLGLVNLARLGADKPYYIDALRGVMRSTAPISIDPSPPEELPRLDWIVAGGESGPKARPSHPDWFRALRDQCAAAGVPFLLKQWGEWLPVSVEFVGDGDVLVPEDGGPADRLDGHRAACTEHAGQQYAKVGKKLAGRLLDGVLHDAYPEARP
jgi:protein gp37